MTYSEIYVRLVEAGTGNVLAERTVPASSLPETFIPGKTALNIKSQPWTVVRADPMTPDEWTQTGQLTLTLTLDQPDTQVPAKDVLYSLPTICDAIPETSVLGENIRTTLLLHEDDWRQIELVAAQYERAIDAELADIEGIVRDHSMKSSETTRAYKKLFVRQRIKIPVMPHLPLSEITAALPGNAWTYGGVGFHSSAPDASSDALITDSFAYDMGLCVIYGQLIDGAVAVIGLHQYGTSNYGDSAAIAAFLDKLMSTNSLYLVDWCWRRKFGSGASAISSYLQKKFAER